MNNRLTVCGIVLFEGKVLLVRHTYGAAKGKLLLPGGHLKDGEMHEVGLEREIFEETCVRAKTGVLIAARFQPNEWLMFFEMDYIDGIPESDGKENDETMFLELEEAIAHPDLTELSRRVLKVIVNKTVTEMKKSDFHGVPDRGDDYIVYGI